MRLKLSKDRKKNSLLTSISSPMKSFLICGLFTIGGVYLGWIGMPGYLKGNYQVIKNSEFWRGLFEVNDLKTIRLDVSFKNFQKIESKRREAIKLNRLISSDEDYVKANLSFGDRNLPCKIRLKGDLSDHWVGDKMSFRVKMKDNRLIYGMSRFSLQKPGTRLNTAEWLFHKTLKQEKLLGLNYEFVNLILNGKPMGIYAIEEHFSKEMIETNQRREGVVVSYEEYRMWNLLFENRRNLHWDNLYRTSNFQTSNSNRIQKSSMLSSQNLVALNLLKKLQEEKLKGENIFAAEKTGKFLALAHFFNAEHGLMYDDMNFYFNPVTCLLEPIGFDANCGTNERSPFSYFTGGSTRSTWINHVLKSPLIAYHYIYYLNEFSQPKFIEKLKTEFCNDEMKYRRLLLKEIAGENASEIWYNFNSLLEYDPWESFKQRASRIRNDLSEPRPILSFAQKNIKNELIVSIRNALSQPVEILGIETDNCSWDISDLVHDERSGTLLNLNQNIVLVIPPFDFHNTGELGDIELKIKSSDFKDLNFDNTQNLSIKVRLLGLNDTPLKIHVPINQDVFQFDGLPNLTTNLDSNYSKVHNFIDQQGHSLIFKTGTHLVKGDLVIPTGFEAIIPSDCSLLFEQNSTFISHGKITAIGMAETPIEISASEDSWGGFLLSGVKETSRFENVIFSKTAGINKGPNPKGIDRSGWTTTGGVTVHESVVTFSNCRFENSFSEDALNLISSNFKITDCFFENLPSDGFDGDFVTGLVDNCLFSNIQGDGIDFSGSRVKVSGCQFINIADKAVSVGESSDVDLAFLKICDVGFGIVAKDSSKVKATSSNIKNASIAGISAYQKKELFGPAKISCESVSISDSKQNFLIQSESFGELDGNQIKEESFQSSEYY
jgi:hypothetical protein